MSVTTVEFTHTPRNNDAGHADALEEVTTLMSERRPYFHRIALRRLKNGSDAENAVQDAFLLAWKNLDNFRGQARMSTWMTVVVMNSARMTARKRARLSLMSLQGHQNSLDDSISLLEILPDQGLDPETEVHRHELRQRLPGLADLLSPHLREVVRLSLKGLSLREIAEESGVSNPAVKSRAMRACRTAPPGQFSACSSHQPYALPAEKTIANPQAVSLRRIRGQESGARTPTSVTPSSDPERSIRNLITPHAYIAASFGFHSYSFSIRPRDQRRRFPGRRRRSKLPCQSNYRASPDKLPRTESSRTGSGRTR
jgi:RNA polymerase sigma-70 factor, ECF subfamily